MPKAVWINPLTTGSTSLDPKLNPHDVDTLGLTKLLERQGYEVWLQEAFKVKRSLSTWDRVVHPEDLDGFEADVAIISCNPFLIDYVGHRYYGEIAVGTVRARRLDMVTRWLDNFKGDLYLLITDPRPAFQKFFFSEKGDHAIKQHVARTKLLVADTGFLVPELRDRGVNCEYWKAVDVGEPLPFSKDDDYLCVYPGLKFQNKDRKKLLLDWLDAPGCYTAGELRLRNVPSVTDHGSVPLAEVLELVRRSQTSLVCGEKTHTWLTPRVIQSLVCGTISSVHPDFAGSHWLPSEMVSEQTVARASEFDVELSERVYKRQVEFAMDLKASEAESGVL